MPINYLSIPHGDLGGAGIDALSSEDSIKEGYAEDLINVDASPQGYLSKRTGYQQLFGQLPSRVIAAEFSTLDPTELTLILPPHIDLSYIDSTLHSRPLIVSGRTSPLANPTPTAQPVKAQGNADSVDVTIADGESYSTASPIDILNGEAVHVYYHTGGRYPARADNPSIPAFDANTTYIVNLTGPTVFTLLTTAGFPVYYDNTFLDCRLYVTPARLSLSLSVLNGTSCGVSPAVGTAMTVSTTGTYPDGLTAPIFASLPPLYVCQRNTWSFRLSQKRPVAATLDPTTDIFYSPAHGLSTYNNLIMHASVYPTCSPAVDANTYFSLVPIDDNHFKLKFTNGSAANFTTAGSGIYLTQGSYINMGPGEGTGTLSYTLTSGDFPSTGTSTVYYSQSKADIRRPVAAGESKLSVLQLEHGLTSPLMQVGVALSTDTQLLNNTQIWTGGYLSGGITAAPGISIDNTTNEIQIRQTNNSGNTISEYVYWKSKEASPGQVFITPFTTGNYSTDFGWALPNSTTTFTVGPYGQVAHNLISVHIQVIAYEIVGNVYRQFRPDSITVDSVGNVQIIVTNNTSSYRSVFFVLTSADSDKVIENQVLSSGTSTIQIADCPSPFLNLSCYYDSTDTYGNSARKYFVPDSIVYDATSKTATVTITASAARNVHLYWEPVFTSINRVKVTTQTPFNTTFVDTSPQLTVWGYNHAKMYNAEAAARAGWVSHLDTYKSVLTEQVVSGLGGNLYSGNVASDTDRTQYNIPILYPNLRNMPNATQTLGPLFVEYTNVNAPNSRDNGVIGGTGWGSGFAPITSIQYVDNYVPYVANSTSRVVTIDQVTNRLLTANPFALGTAINFDFTGNLPDTFYNQDNEKPTFYVRSVTPGVGFTISLTPTGPAITLPNIGPGVLTASPVCGRVLVTLTDANLAQSLGVYLFKGKERLTIQDVSNSIHNGSWVIDDYQIDTNHGVAKFWVINTNIADLVKANPEFITSTNGPATLWNCTAGGTCGVFTGMLVAYNIKLLAGDRVLAPNLTEDNPVTVVDTLSYGVIVEGVYQNTTFETGTVVTFRRTSNILPLRDSILVANTNNLVENDNLSITNYERQFKIKSINPLDNQYIKSITGDGLQATATLYKSTNTNSFAVGDQLLLAQAGAYSGVITVASIVDLQTFTFESSASGTYGPFTENSPGAVTAIPASGLFQSIYSSVSSFVIPVCIFATTMPKVSTAPGAADAFDPTQVYYLNRASYNTFYLSATPTSGQILFATAGSGVVVQHLIDYKGAVLVGHTVTLDESVSLEDSASSAISVSVPGRWLPIEAPDHAASEAPSSYSRYLSNSTYDNQPILKSTEVSDSLFLTNGDDRPLKFDGSSVYRPGLPRWQPQLFFNQTSSPASYDAVQGLIPLIKTTIPITGWSRNYFTVAPSDVASFAVGTKIRRSNDATSVYTVIGTKGGNSTTDVVTQIIVDRNITGTYSASAGETLTNASTYSYYFRLNLVDANDNIIASAATGSQDCTVIATSDFQNRIRLVGLPTLDVYDYDRMEVQIYRTKQNGVAPFYLLSTIAIPFGANVGYIDWVDTKDDSLIEVNSQLDPVNTALKGQELGVGWTPPMRAKHVTSSANRMVLGNITSDPYIDLVIRNIGSTVSSSNLTGNRFLLRKSNLDNNVVTEMNNRIGYRFVTTPTAAVSNITPVTGGFQITTNAAHELIPGSWAYLGRPSFKIDAGYVQDFGGTNLLFSSSATSSLRNLVNGQKVRIQTTSDAVPLTTPALVSGKSYYVVYNSNGNFKLSATPGGAPLVGSPVSGTVTAGITTAAATISATATPGNSSFTTASAHNLAVGDAITMAATTFPTSDISVTVSVATPSVFTSTSAHGLVANQRVRFTATTYPTGSPALAPDTDYYVQVLSPTTFTIATAVGGSGLGFTAAGSGVTVKQVTLTPYQANTTYYVREVVNSTTFTLSDTSGGTLKSFYTAGSGITITIPKLQNAIITSAATGLSVGASITLTGGSLPAPLTAGITYFIVAIGGTAIKLSATLNGTPITITATGTGTFTTTQLGNLDVYTDNPSPGFAGWWQVKDTPTSYTFTVDWPNCPAAGTYAPTEAPLSLITAYDGTFESLYGVGSSTLDVPVYLGMDYNYQVANGQPSSSGLGIENLATRRLAAAINTTQRMVNKAAPSVYAIVNPGIDSLRKSLLGYYQDPVTGTKTGTPEYGMTFNSGPYGANISQISFGMFVDTSAPADLSAGAGVVVYIRKQAAAGTPSPPLYTSALITYETLVAAQQLAGGSTPIYPTFTFSAPVLLDPNTQYSVGVAITSSTTINGGATYIYLVGGTSAFTYPPFIQGYKLTYPQNQITFPYNAPTYLIKMYASPALGYANFTPWIMANAGSDFAEGQILLSQPMNQNSTFELLLPSQFGSSSTPAYSVFANGIQRTPNSQIQAHEDLHPSRIVVSYPNFPEIFDSPFATVDSQSDSAIDVNPSDGQEITACIPFFGASAFGAALKDAVIVVFKTNSIYVVNLAAKAAGQVAVQKIESQGIGCTAPQSVSVVRDGILFANPSGIYKLKTDLSVYYIGRHLQNQWRSEVDTTSLELAFGHNWAFGSQYKLSVPSKGSAVPDRTYVYNSTREYTIDGAVTPIMSTNREGSWVKHTGFSAIGWCNLEADSLHANTAGQVLILRRTGGISDWRDDEAPIQMQILLRSMDFGDDGVRKTVPYALITYRNPPSQGDRSGTQVEYTTDMQDVFELADATVLANRVERRGISDLGGPRIITLRYSFGNKRGVRFQLKILNSTKDENVELTRIRYYIAGLNIKGILQAASSPKMTE